MNEWNKKSYNRYIIPLLDGSLVAVQEDKNKRYLTIDGVRITDKQISFHPGNFSLFSLYFELSKWNIFCHFMIYLAFLKIFIQNAVLMRIKRLPDRIYHFLSVYHMEEKSCMSGLIKDTELNHYH